MRASLLAFAIFATGCGGSLAQLRSDNRRLADQLATARADLRLERRKAKDLSNQVLVLTDRLDTAAVHRPDTVIAPPPLPVEVLAPDDLDESGSLIDDEAAAIDDGGEPVELADLVEASPPPAPARPRARSTRPARDPLHALPTPSQLDRGPAPKPTATDDDAALDLYRRGMAALKGGDHAGAIASFRELIAAYPRHDYADNAQYWLGEAYYDQKDYARAVPEFRATVSTYPLGNKVPDALLKVGLAYAALGEPAKARAALEQVIRQFPTTAPAAIAATRLEQLP